MLAYMVLLWIALASAAVVFSSVVAGVALVEAVEIGLDHAFDILDIVSAGHGVGLSGS